MQLENVNNIKALQVKMMNGKVMPDFKRLYIADRLLIEKNLDQRLVLKTLLEGYDHGKIDVFMDPWDRCIKYAPLDLN